METWRLYNFVNLELGVWGLGFGTVFTTEGAILEDVEGEINSTPSYSPLCSFNFVKQGFIL